MIQVIQNKYGLIILERRRSLQGRHSLTDSDSSYSLIQENAFTDELKEDSSDVENEYDSFLEEVRTNEELIDSEIITIDSLQEAPTTTSDDVEEEEIDDDLYSFNYF